MTFSHDFHVTVSCRMRNNFCIVVVMLSYVLSFVHQTWVFLIQLLNFAGVMTRKEKRGELIHAITRASTRRTETKDGMIEKNGTDERTDINQVNAL